MDAKKITVETMKVSDLKPNPRNPRRISDAALKRLEKSVERFGLVEPIVYNKRSGFIVGGHQRVKALKGLGEKTATVVVVDLDETDEAALNLSLNSPELAGSFADPVDEIINAIAEQDRNLVEDLALNEIRLEDYFEDTDAVKDLDIPEPVERVWVLIGVPIERYDRVDPVVRKIAEDPDIFVQTTAANA